MEAIMKSLTIINAIRECELDSWEEEEVRYDRANYIFGIFEERCQECNDIFGEYVLNAQELIRDELYNHWVYFCSTHSLDNSLIRGLEIIIWSINGLDQTIRYRLGGILKEVFGLPYGWLTSHHVYDGDVYSPLYFAVLLELQKMVITASYRLINCGETSRLIYASWHVIDIKGSWKEFQDYSWEDLPNNLRKKVMKSLAIHMAAIRKYMRVCDADLLDTTIGNIQWWSNTSTEEVEQWFYLYK